MLIAIDGIAASGKTTISRILANYLNVTHINTGACYRAVALYAHENNLDPNNYAHVQKLMKDLHMTFIARPSEGRYEINSVDRTDELFTAKVGDWTRPWTPIPEIRAFTAKNWVNWAQIYYQNAGGCVVEGRGIGRICGTTIEGMILPPADLKVWVKASVEARVRRRMLQAKIELTVSETGELPYDAELHKQLSARDEVDVKLGNVEQPDALVLDTTVQSVEESLGLLKNVFRVLHIQPHPQT